MDPRSEKAARQVVEDGIDPGEAVRGVIEATVFDFKSGDRVRLRKGRDVRIPFGAKELKGSQGEVRRIKDGENVVVQFDNGAVFDIRPDDLEKLSEEAD